MTIVSKSITADDLRHELIAFAEDQAQREYLNGENARLKKDQALAQARYYVWRNFAAFLKDLHIVSADTEG